MARAYGFSFSDSAFLNASPGATVILGASRFVQLHDNLAALDAKAKFTPDVKISTADILKNKPEGPLRD